MGAVEVLDPVAPARAGGWIVDVSRGERKGRVSSEWLNRPDDERYLSLDDLWASVNALSKPVGRARYFGRDHQSRRRQSAARPVPGCDGHDAPWSRDMAQNMGDTDCPSAWLEAGDGCAGAQDRCHLAPDVGRGNRLPCQWSVTECSLRIRVKNKCSPDGEPSRSPQGRGPDDAVVRAVALYAEHADEMAHRNCV